MKFEPVIKWTGSKRKQSYEIIKKIPNKKYKTYYEPFCGSCSVLFQLLHSDIKFEKYICSDLNNELIELWIFIKENPNIVSSHYRKLWTELYNLKDVSSKKVYYNQIRTRFNRDRNPLDFLFLTRTAINGIIRYNSKKEFNSSFHLTRNGIMPDKFDKIINNWSYYLNKYDVQFINQSYENIVPNKNDFVYLDPPYINTKGLYFNNFDIDTFLNKIKTYDCDYLLSFDGKRGDSDLSIPLDFMDEHHFSNSENSSLNNVLSRKQVLVKESLYVHFKKS